MITDPLDPPPARRGMLLVLSSPSGGGKSTMAKRLLAEEAGLSVSVSATTRAPRPGETDGRDYHFVSNDDFDALIADEMLAEWAVVFGNRYGTPRGPLTAALERGDDVLFDIDWQGTQQLKARDAKDVVSIFLLPPSMAELEQRLRGRGTDSDEVIAGRMARAAAEISHWSEYDYVLVNDDADRCFANIRTILSAERLRRSRCKAGLSAYVRGLLAQS